MDGFERRDQPGARVIIIGAGMAGLVAGCDLARAGHDPLILEPGLRAAQAIHEAPVPAARPAARPA